MRRSDGVGAAVALAPGELPLMANRARAVTRIYEIDPLRDPRWPALVDRHPHASVFHSTNWLRALQMAYRYEPVAITACPPDADLTHGLVFCRIQSWLTGRRLVSLPFSDHCEPLVDCSEELDQMLLLMKQAVDEKKWEYAEIRPLSYQSSSFSRVVSSAYQLHSLDLRPSAEELFRCFHKDCVQRKIRRAEREDLNYEEGSSEVLLQKFYRLLVMTRRRHGVPPQPLAWFRSLVDTFGDGLKIRLASKGDVPIAAILTLHHKRSMVYKYGCSNAEFNKCGGMAFLFWRTIQDAKDKGCEEFDMGRSGTENLSLATFKERWGAAGTPLSYWRYPQNPSSGGSSPWPENITRRLVSVVPDFVLEAAGALFYRHIG